MWSPARAYMPALHVQFDRELLPAGDCLAIPQLMQNTLAAAAVYLPAAHCAHTPTLARNEPALHAQLIGEKLPAGEAE